MRDDFSKQLVERERIHSWDKFHNYRNKKGPSGLNDDEVGGRQSMRKPYNYGYDRKHFSENLNPLYGWLRTCLGKNWDKCYSELRQKFDTRSVINQHILEHLWSSISTNTFVGDKGQVMVRDGRWGVVPVADCFTDYYVCPKSGTVKQTHKRSFRTIQRERAKQRELDKLKTERWLDKDTVLKLIDGTWYAFEMKDAPLLSYTYHQPPGRFEFECGTWGKKIKKRWEDMNQSERVEHGVRALIAIPPTDVLTGKQAYRIEVSPRFGSRQGGAPKSRIEGVERYHATKKTASHRQLKQAGII